ncbi:bifunctional 2-polyprenyl-6-hydroxyphenol methylase/3-demethylubiquinol 3-O-methyltransferase UbiG, partial [Frankia sp. EI5c]|uniref:class I SAM-dependent methyltransferase n=1 Tax=Frankia sp. EI5c TaxID=683316 RepID=UPI001F5BB543
CGPGYLARAVSGRVWSVAAVDVSRGVLACARVLNPAINIDYRTPREFFGSGRRVDIAVSLTMASRLGDDELSALLSSVRASVRPGGRLVLQAALPDPRPTADLGSSPAPESDPESGAGPEPGLELRSARPAGRSERRRAVRGGGLRNRYLDPHHPRAAEHLVRLIERAGFADVELHLLREPDPAGRPERNCLLVAVRRHDPVPRRADRESVWPPDRVAEPAASS